ncbi:ABC transporter ATP-binding protein [Campylobacter canadensis]|uniref:ABC transporter ATP-binding protein n=1 Tax=Campylobacter canadensis TaxID=449520 RepID=A0ABS7WR52_9BACT|nr:ABC transporter ATP-binding protein [Campylobacter canadensis]MBZ7987243.1 ABC transporter ATP-binding protein [Campylobacter canadensis]MBZ7994321.1 ABC transporter ATP-binding protein [Campylobacter canadensis]MBZ7996017.1 ABC transporter ATP-binding protein [Campylobacter canadensis]MBZ7998328.1 ABC transporter ATP-binding protein [Campylobacter canadensis]MBZ7999653.1 ABC transporter ATP-binding protein [Campylobacter canadensis]
MNENINLWYVLKRFKHYYKDYKLSFFIAIVGMLLAGSATAASAKIIEPILNKIFLEKDTSLLYILPAGVILIYFLKNFGLYLQTTRMSFIGIDMINRLRILIVSKVVHMDMEFFSKHSSGELISRSLNDLGSVKSILTDFLPNMIRELITTIGLLAVVFYQSLTLAFFAFVVLPAAIFPIRYFVKKLRVLGTKNQQSYAILTSNLSEIFSNIELIKSFNSEKYEINKFKNNSDEVSKLSYKATRFDALTSPIMETFGSIGVATVIIVGGNEVINGNMLPGNFFSFLTALFMVYTPVRRISSLYSQLQVNLSASARTFYLLDLQSKIQSGDKTIDEEIKKLSFSNVCMSYKENKLALDDINIDFIKGQTTAIVGKSGSGKSTLVNLILKFYNPSAGDITVNSINYKDLDNSSLMKEIAIVSQNIYLFADSIANNIAYASEFDELRVIDALKMANAYEFVSAMSEGIYTKLSEKGNNLSGGQKQRLALARAFYKNPQIIIFDEATSALDNESQNLISSSLMQIKKDKIIILIAHRLNSIASADKILVLHNSKVVGYGNEEDLKDNRYYLKLKEEFKKESKK